MCAQCLINLNQIQLFTTLFLKNEYRILNKEQRNDEVLASVVRYSLIAILRFVFEIAPLVPMHRMGTRGS